MEDYNYTNHWDHKYQTTEDSKLGWFEDNPQPTLQLLEKCNLSKEAAILNVGAGTTTLIDELVKEGFTNVIANDISEVALNKLQQRIKDNFNYSLNCIVDDLTNPTTLNSIDKVDMWIDRAVLHFFLKKEEQQAYFELIKKTVAKGGYVLIAVFALDGAPKCCGLDLKRYDLKMLQESLGATFQLIDSFNHTYVNPFGGERPYIYTLFKKQ